MKSLSLKIMNFFRNERIFYLKKINSGDSINILSPNDIYVEKDGIKKYNVPIVATVLNNHVRKRKLWIEVKLRNDDFNRYILKYSSYELSEFILLNVFKKQKTLKQLEDELKEAVKNEYFELALLINNKIKEYKKDA